jgi:hypothetical protein
MSSGPPSPHSRERNDANLVVAREVSAMVTLAFDLTTLDTSKDTDLVAGLVAWWSRTAPIAGAVW